MKNEILKYLTFTLFISLILVVTISCSQGEGKEVLSIFFDGVDEEEVEDSVVTIEEENTEESNDLTSTGFLKVINYHEAYVDKQCDNCHETIGSNKLIEAQPGLCYSCHDDFSEEYTFMHGPASSGYCTSCHDPHKSKNEKLLKRTGQELCLYCHNQKDILANDVHEDIEDTDCTECHNPHGGEDKYFL